MAEISVGRCGPSDGALLAALRRRWFAVAGDPGFEERFADWYAAESEGGRRLFWVAVASDSGEPVGMVNLAVFTRMPRPGVAASRWGYLGNAFVVEEYRDRGVGGLLLAALLRHARDEGFVRVVLSPSERSVPFYERAGFGPADMLMALTL